MHAKRIKKAIGIVGGVGPYAGLDLNKKIFDHMKTKGLDQDYLDVFLVSRPSDIPDRTSFLKNNIDENPAEGLFRSTLALEKLGASVIAIPCNTAHSPKIFNTLCTLRECAGCQSTLLHIVEETHHFIENCLPHYRKIGLLGTLGTFETRLYETYFEKQEKFSILVPDDDGKQACHKAIYDKKFGIKAVSSPIDPKAKKMVCHVMDSLIDQGAQAIILGCTELPLAFEGEHAYNNTLLIDPTMVLARALIAHVDKKHLKPYRLESRDHSKKC